MCGVQCVYADMRGNVLVHCKVPSLGLNAVQWAVVSWAASQKQRETVYDAKYFYRCCCWTSKHAKPFDDSLATCMLEHVPSVPA